MTPEGKLVEFLIRECHANGLDQRKIEYSGRLGAPDRLILGKNFAAFIELKAPGEAPRPSQVREFERLRQAGLPVFVCDSKESVQMALEYIYARGNFNEREKDE